MSIEVEKAKDFIQRTLDRDFDLVPTPSGSGNRVRASAWSSRNHKVSVAFEDKQTTLTNIWLRTEYLTPGIRSKVTCFHRVWDDAQRKWVGEDGPGGANHNLLYYPEQFGPVPITRLRITTLEEAILVFEELADSCGLILDRVNFLLKINGAEDAPDGISRPASAADWNGGAITLPWGTPRASSYSDKRPGPMPKTGDAFYIWTHEDPAFGNGKGLTAMAKATAVSEGEGTLSIVLGDVDLLPRPFGFRELKGKGMSTLLLDEIHAARGSRAWCMTPQEEKELRDLIEDYGSAKAAAMAEAARAYLSDLDKALIDEKDEIEQAEHERKTATTKARPHQAAFRARAMERHHGRCVVTGFNVASVLEAAHVIPHTGNPAFEVPENSLILRRDIHALFDAHLIAIHPKSGKLLVSQELESSPYKKLAGKEVPHKLVPQSLNYQFQRFQNASKPDIAA